MLVETVFESGAFIPKKYTCDGVNLNPPLRVSDIPTGTKTLAVIMDDPDAPIGTFVHWVAWNIPAEGRDFVDIPEGVSKKGLFEEGTNDFRRIGYDGPCPPPGHGIHHYYIKIYALKERIKLPTNATKKDLLNAIEGKILEKCEIVGIYQR